MSDQTQEEKKDPIATPKNYSILRHFPFHMLNAVRQLAALRSIEVLSVNGLFVASMDDEDRERMAQVESDSRYLFKVNGAFGLVDAGTRVNGLLSDVAAGTSTISGLLRARYEKGGSAKTNIPLRGEDEASE